MVDCTIIYYVFVYTVWPKFSRSKFSGSEKDHNNQISNTMACVAGSLTTVFFTTLLISGAVVRRDADGSTDIQSTSTSSERNSYQGYAVVSGRFISQNRQGTYIVWYNIHVAY